MSGTEDKERPEDPVGEAGRSPVADPLLEEFQEPSSASPLVQRVDALLRRHQEQLHALRQPRPDEELQPDPAPAAEPLPIVTEVPEPAAIPVFHLDEDIPLLTEIVDPSEEMRAAAQVVDAEQLAVLLQAAVMEKLLPEIDKALEQRLARNITDLLEQVLHGLRAELTVSVKRMVREAVSAAVARELARRPELGAVKEDKENTTPPV